MIARRSALLALVLFQLMPQVGHATAAPEREGFALVLGGGGAKGFAHIGVMRALEELGLTPSVVVGTSMGAVLGSLYASGLSADEIEARIQDRHWSRTLLDRTGPPAEVQGGWSTLPPAQVRLHIDEWPPTLPAGASQGHSFESLVGQLTADAVFDAGQDFDALPIPFRAVATDLMSAEATVFDRGPLARLVRASGSLPLVFVPVQYEGRHYVDGGFTENLPLRVAREMGFSRAIVVDVSNAFVVPEEPPSDLIELLRRATQIAQRSENAVEATDQDVVLHLDMRAHTVMSFYDADAIVRTGYDGLMAERARVLALADASGPAARRPRPTARARGPVEIGALDVQGVRRFSPWSIRKRLGLVPGDAVELETLHVRAEELSRQPVFESVWIESRPGADGRAHVVAHVEESDRPELEVAANYRDDIGPGAMLRLRLDNRLGVGGSRAATWRISPEAASLRVDTAVPVRGSRRVEFRLGGGWIRESIDVVRGRDDAWNFQRGEMDAEIVLARRMGLPALHVGVESADGRRHLASRDPAGNGGLAWRAVRIGFETWSAGGLGTWPDAGVSLHARRGFQVLGGRSDAWTVEGGWVGRPLTRRLWGVNLAVGGGWSAEDLPKDLQPRAGGPRTWIGKDPYAIIAPRLLWGRAGLDLYVNREVRFEIAGAVGWAGRRSLDEQPARPGAQLRLVWESALGPIQLGWAGGRGSQPRLVLDVGSRF